MNNKGQYVILGLILFFVVVMGFFATQLDFGESYDPGFVGGDEFDVTQTPEIIPTTTNDALFWMLIVPLSVLLIAVLVGIVFP